MFPDRISADDVINVLELSDSDKLLTDASKSDRAGEAENEQFKGGGECKSPEDFEDHVQHWKRHMNFVRDWAFKNLYDPEIQARTTEHVLAHEMFMAERAQKDPSYQQKLSLLNGWPAFFTLPTPPAPMPPAPMPPEQLPPPGGQPPMEGPMPTDPGAPQMSPDGMDVAPPMPSLDEQAGVEPLEENQPQPSSAQ